MDHPVAVFFSCIALMLVGMTIWELKSPTVERKGFLPIRTTRGDRLFIGLLAAAWVNLAFLGLGGKAAEWFSLDGPPSVDQLRGLDAVAGLHHEERLTGRPDPARTSKRFGRTIGQRLPGQESAAQKRGDFSRRLFMKFRMRAVAAAIALIGTSAAWAGEPEAQKWIDSEFQPSTLSKDQQLAEMKWFIEAAAKLKAQGVNEINVVSETITTHEYESKTLAKAFSEITGIKVTHDLIQEGDVVEKLQTSMQSGKSIYDGWISDSDLIGTHYRYGAILPLSDYMAGAGKEWTNPNLDLKDFIGTKFTTAPDGKLYQLPDQQFANVLVPRRLVRAPGP